VTFRNILRSISPVASIPSWHLETRCMQSMQHYDEKSLRWGPTVKKNVSSSFQRVHFPNWMPQNNFWDPGCVCGPHSKCPPPLPGSMGSNCQQKCVKFILMCEFPNWMSQNNCWDPGCFIFKMIPREFSYTQRQRIYKHVQLKHSYVPLTRSFQELFGKIKHALSGHVSVPVGLQNHSVPLEFFDFEHLLVLRNIQSQMASNSQHGSKNRGFDGSLGFAGEPDATRGTAAPRTPGDRVGRQPPGRERSGWAATPMKKVPGTAGPVPGTSGPSPGPHRNIR